ncbi:MAG TPA: glucose 1-dehydrogenase [Gammaproteobacteria bacterium]|nr:glucose 1-dehydrogenase [Gammaproteobacteria bacterium]
MKVFDLFRLDGCVALVTGGSRGIGLELAEALYQAGARVGLAARRPRFFDQAREQIPDALCLECDVIDEDSVRDAVTTTERELGPIDVLVNSAGVSWGAPAVDMAAERFRQVMQVNVDGSFLASKAVAPGMLERGYGKIINIASVAGLRGEEPEILDAVGYSASKGAVISMTRDLAVKWGPSGVRVNALAPGYFPSRMTHKLLEQTESLLAAKIPLRRIGRPGELAGAGLYLASPASDYVNGHVLVVDGGQTC